MQEVTIKKEASINLDKDVKQFLNPKFVFVPIEEGYKLKVADNDYVYKNDIVAMNARGAVMTSSISGRVLGLKKMDYYQKASVPSLVIENDFKENIRSKKSARKHVADYSKKDFLRILEDTSYNYKGTFLYKKFRGTCEEIIINGVEIDPYFGNKYCMLHESLEDILEMGDFLMDMLEAKKVYFVLKNTDDEAINKLTSLLGTYPNIELKLVSDAYPNGMGEVQKRILKFADAMVIELEEMLDMFRILKRERAITSKLITVTGSAVEPRSVVRVKIGTLLSEVFVHNFDFTSPKVDVFINGTLYGDKVESLKYVIDSDIDGIYVCEKSEVIENPCLNCGQCSKSCPMGLNPKYVCDHEGKVNSEYYDKCLQCGLCNYVCPVDRDLKSRMRGCDES